VPVRISSYSNCKIKLMKRPFCTIKCTMVQGYFPVNA